MAKGIRITVSQIMAILALLGILLSVVGTAWLGQQPVSTITETPILMSDEVTPIVSE